MRLNRRSFLTALLAVLPSRWLPVRQQVCDTVVAAFHIPLPMVGLLDEATFNGVRDQHRQFYADTFAPWFQQLYAQQPTVQTCVEFKADGITYRLVSAPKEWS